MYKFTLGSKILLLVTSIQYCFLDILNFHQFWNLMNVWNSAKSFSFLGNIHVKCVHSKYACTFQNACDLFNSCRFLIVTVASLSVGKHEFYYICTVLVLQVYLVQYLIFAKWNCVHCFLNNLKDWHWQIKRSKVKLKWKKNGPQWSPKFMTFWKLHLPMA